MLIGTVLYVLKTPLLKLSATLLIDEDELQKADAMFVLSGGAYDRGNEAVKLFDKGYSPNIICTGGNPFAEVKVFNIDTLEVYMTVANLTRQGVDKSKVVILPEGTSTREEALIIIKYCKEHQIKKAILLSSLLHTGRVKSVFGPMFKANGLGLIVRGAPSSRFNEYEWWKSEDGLIAVNNEWLKTIYYWLKY